MKKTVLGALFIVVMLLASSGCYTAPPAVAVQTSPAVPAPPVPPSTAYVQYAPDYYVWDGAEYVGVSGGNYVYWTGGSWLLAPPIIIGHFNGWQRYHPDWRRHAVPYHYGHRYYQHGYYHSSGPLASGGFFNRSSTGINADEM